MKEFLPYLRQFYEVVRAGGFTAASRTLRVSQPSISKSIGLLEAQVGKKLLIRSKRGVALTEDGQLIYATCKDVFSSLENLELSLRSEQVALTGRLKIGVSDNLAIHVLPKYIDAFLRQHKDVVFEVFSGTSNDIKEEIKRMRTEFGIFYTKPEEHEGFISEQIAIAEFVVVMGTNNRWFSKGKTITTKDLSENDVPNIASRTVDYLKEPPALKNVKKLNLPTQAVIECNQHETKKKFVELGMGYSVLIRHSVQKEIDEKLIKIVETGTPLLVPVHLVYMASRPLSKAALAFKAHLLNRDNGRNALASSL